MDIKFSCFFTFKTHQQQHALIHDTSTTHRRRHKKDLVPSFDGIHPTTEDP